MRNKAPRIVHHRDLLNNIGNNAEERAGFLAMQAALSEARRKDKFPDGLAVAIRKDLLAIFAKDGKRIGSIHRAREMFGTSTPVKGLDEKEFDQWLERRTAESFTIEHNFLTSLGRLVSFSRGAFKELIDTPPEDHFKHCHEIIDLTLRALIAIRNDTPGYTPRKRGSLMVGESLDPIVSIDFISGALEMNLAQAKQALIVAEKISKPQTIKSDIESSHDQAEWLKKLIEFLENLLAHLRNITTQKQLHAPKEVIPEAIKQMITIMDAAQVALAHVSLALEANPSMYASQQLALLKDLASTAKDVQEGKATTPQR